MDIKKLILFIFILVFIAGCDSGPYGYGGDEDADRADYLEGKSEAATAMAMEDDYYDSLSETFEAWNEQGIKDYYYDLMYETDQAENYYVPYPDEDPYKDSPEYQVEYQNYLDENDGID